MTVDVASLTYVYAVTWSAAPVPDDLETVVHRELAAVTKPAPEQKLRARRRDLLDHADVAQRVFDGSTVVPLQFGSVVGDVVRDLLEPRHDELAELLRRLAGLAEVTVRAVYREEDVLRALLADDPRLRRLRETAIPVRLGEAVAHALQARRERDADAIVRVLERHACAVAVDELRTELDIFRGAALVERKRLPQVDDAVTRLARELAGTASFKLTGPLPPHHFVGISAGAS